MDARRAAYVRQQIELGGPEIYLESAESPAPGGVSGEVQPTEQEEPDVPSKRLEFPAGNAESGAPVTEQPKAGKWRAGAPAIPGPGLLVEPPVVDLMGNEITRAESLDEIARLISGCTRCVLCKGRKHTVPGEGNPAARLMCIGEGPGATEDGTGRPFVGAAGQLLDQILAAIDCPRPTVYIANIVKCRPPQNRKPLPDEATSCMPFLHRQIALVKPKVILAMGGTAAEWLLNSKKSLGELRTKVHRYGSIPLIVTYHPAALLRNPNWKKPTWDDVRIARQLLDG